MTDYDHGRKSGYDPAGKASHQRGAFMAGALLLCCATSAPAAEFDISTLDLDSYTYPDSHVVEKRQEQTYARLVLLTQDQPAGVVAFYENTGLKLQSGDGNSPGPMVFETRKLSEHALLDVTIDTDGSRSSGLDDHDLFRDLEIHVASGSRSSAQMDKVRQRFNGLKQRFYVNNPSATLHECRSSSGNTRKESMEDRARRMQEMAMQGRTAELQQMMKGMNRDTNLSSGSIPAEKWDSDIECLEKLERESYRYQITVVASRDDLLG